jgi:hypothetical protein
MLNSALRKLVASPQTRSILLRRALLRPHLPAIASQYASFSTAVQSSSSSAQSTASVASSPPFVSTPERTYQYFANVEVTPSGVAVIKFDNPTKKVNSESIVYIVL